MSSEDFNARFLAWFSVAIVLAVLGFIGLAMFGGIAKADDPVAMLVIGGLMSILTMVIGYWFGSSAGSKRAADRLAAVQGGRRRMDLASGPNLRGGVQGGESAPSKGSSVPTDTQNEGAS